MKLAILLVVGVIAKVYGDEPEAIVGGNIAQPGQFPHQVSLRMNNNHFCGGTIISPTHVVTAAHCISSDSMRMTVVTGAHYLSSGGAAYRVKCIQVHPQYSNGWNGIQNDIAVITLATPITFSNQVRAMPLASMDYSKGGASAIVSGWGKTHVNSGVSSVLKWLGVTCLSTQECQRYHGGVINGNQVCTFKAHGHGACHGDSGGPLVCNGELIGVVSWGKPCAVGAPDVFTNVYNYRGYIKQCQQQC